MIKSDIADIKNISSNREAGTITAAEFLHEFIDDKNVKWAHLDIAGTADSSKATRLNTKGATGFGVHLLNDYINNNYSKIK